MSHVGTGALVAAFLTLASAAGSMSFSAILTGAVVSGPLRDVLFGLFFFGFGVKAGVIPLHVWLPEAHPAAPSSISALMSAVLIKAGIYGLFRVCAFGLGTPTAAWGLTCMGVGTLSAILGVLYALTQNDLKRMLAYSTIENAGIILLGLGAGMTMLAAGQIGAGGRGDCRQSLPRDESRRVQRTPVPGRGKRGDGDRHTSARGDGRPPSAHALDRRCSFSWALWRSRASHRSTASPANG